MIQENFIPQTDTFNTSASCDCEKEQALRIRRIDALYHNLAAGPNHPADYS